MIILKKKRVELGKGYIIQYTIFENKKFGGIWIYNWKTIEQNRFHTHAFSAYAFLLKGSYIEEVIKDGKIIKTISENVNSINVSNLSQGIYILKIETKDGMATTRFVKQ